MLLHFLIFQFNTNQDFVSCLTVDFYPALRAQRKVYNEVGWALRTLEKEIFVMKDGNLNGTKSVINVRTSLLTFVSYTALAPFLLA